MNTLIDDFIKDTGALVPKPNPAYVKSNPSTSLVPKMCKKWGSAP